MARHRPVCSHSKPLLQRCCNDPAGCYPHNHTLEPRHLALQFVSTLRGTKALILQLLRTKVAPEDRAELFRTLICVSYLAEINLVVVLMVAMPSMVADSSGLLPEAAVGKLMALGTAGLTVRPFVALSLKGLLLPEVGTTWWLQGLLGSLRSDECWALCKSPSWLSTAIQHDG